MAVASHSVLAEKEQIPHSIGMHQANKKSKASTLQTENSFAWHHIRGVVPADWEITAYSVEDQEGRLEFNSRRGLEAAVSWEPCNFDPDRLATMATVLENRISKGKKELKIRSTDFKTAEIGPFLVGWIDETLPCQALAYKAKSGHLIRWMFEGHSSQAHRDKIIRPILESCDFNQDEAGCEYHVSGIQCILPWDYKVKDIVLLPANVMISFESETSKRKTVFRRWGLAGMLLGSHDLTDFYKPILTNHGIIVDTCTPCHVDGWEARRLTFNIPSELQSDRIMRRRWTNGVAIIWHDGAANRINAFEQVGPDNTKALDFNAIFPGHTLKEQAE